MMWKCCSKCNVSKEINEFSKGSKYKGGYKSQCKACDKQYKLKNKEAEQERNRQYRINNKAKIKKYEKQYYLDNKDTILKRVATYHKEKIETDINYKIAKNLRVRLYCALKQNFKTGSAVDDLGCSIEELKKHLEYQFQEGMTWDNWNQTGWHIDHIKPLSSFDLTDREQFKEACHYTNLQPLWAEDNHEKSNNI